MLIFTAAFENGNACAWSQTIGGVGLPSCGTPTLTSATPTYSSDGRLMHLSRSGLPEQIFYFYFYGRPIAQMERSGSDTVRRIVTDHLGTPILMAELGIGGVAWQGGFEPFGRDWREGTTNGAAAKNLLLRLPGQWEDESWREAAEGVGVYYNLARWYSATAGRYAQVDPLASISPALETYPYAASNPLTFSDPLGLFRAQELGRPNAEILKICGGTGTKGCVRPDLQWRCHCVPDGCRWRPRPKVAINEPVPLYYSTDCYDTDVIRREEGRHVAEYQGDFNDAKNEARDLGRKEFNDKKSCELACFAWTVRTQQDLLSLLAHKWIDFTHPWKDCQGNFSP